ncbi:MAG: cadmium-translocating P-type ATPase [Erysipelotrichaceae bacterium]|nr:cadmium-translocating P-type ATPase [Erysipelotrichaceae bacterium]
MLNNLDCANCAAKIERMLKEADTISSVSVDFMSKSCSFNAKDYDAALADIKAIVAKTEPDVVVSEVKIEDDFAKQEKKMIIRLVIGIVLFVLGYVVKGTLGSGFFLGAYVLLGYDVLYKAVRNVFKGNWFDENFLMALATVGALVLGDFAEGCAVMLFYQVGELFQQHAVHSSRSSITQLMDLRPDSARVLKNGEYVETDPNEINIGDIVQVQPGEKIPLDGVVVKGSSTLDTSSLTGESLPREIEEGDNVLSGCVNLNGLLEIRVTKLFGDSTAVKILELVENTSSRKAKSEQFITKFAKVYTPIVVICAVGLVVLLPLLFKVSFNDAIYRACTFLVISCPCALVISIPLSFFAGIGGLSKTGILIKGSTMVEQTAELTTIVMDKTGTLTRGKFGVVKVLGEQECLKLAALAEGHSSHPIALSIREACGEVDDKGVEELHEKAGFGIEMTYEGHQVLVGNHKLMEGVELPEINEVGTLVHVAMDGKYVGTIVVADQLKDDAKEAISSLKKMGMKTYMVSGDNEATAKVVADSLGIDKYHAECLPDEKVKVAEGYMGEGKMAFVGDGINDAPVLALADVGIAMGGLGSDAAIEAADVVIMDDALSKIALAIAHCRRTMSVVKQNIAIALIIKIGTLILGAFGIANMWMAVFADVGVAVICILNSMRMLKVR